MIWLISYFLHLVYTLVCMTHDLTLCPASSYHSTELLSAQDFNLRAKNSNIVQTTVAFLMHAKIKKTYNHKIIKIRILQNGHRRWFKPYQNQKTESSFFVLISKNKLKVKWIIFNIVN